MKRLLMICALGAALALPAPVAAFHHGGLPARVCANEAAGSPSNDNGQAKEAIIAHNGHFDGPPTEPLPPVGTPGNGQGEGGEHCDRTQG